MSGHTRPTPASECQPTSGVGAEELQASDQAGHQLVRQRLKSLSRELDLETTRYPGADVSPAKFEQFVVNTFRSIKRDVHDFQVTLFSLPSL